MWNDWSKRTQVSCQARCSSRQFVNSGGTPGKTFAPVCELRSSSTGFAAVASRSSRLRWLMRSAPWPNVFMSPVTGSTQVVAVLGLGEAGGRLAADLVSPDGEVRGYDPPPLPAPDGVEQADDP